MTNLLLLNPLDLPSCLISDRKSLPHTSGVYFVVRNDEVVYVGQAGSLKSRWTGHKLLKLLPPSDRIHWLETKSTERRKVETLFLQRFNPTLNRFIPSTSDPTDVQVVKVSLPALTVKKLNEIATHAGITKTQFVIIAVERLYNELRAA